MKQEPNTNLPNLVRKRAQWLVLIDNLLVIIGFYLLFPMITVHYVDNLGWSAALVTAGLALRTFTQQGLTVLAGAYADRIGAKPLITAGLALRGISFLIFAHADSISLLMLSCLVAGLGGALFDSPKSAVIVKLTRSKERAHFYALLGTLGTVGTCSGAALGGWLLAFDFRWVAYAGACSFFIASILTLWLLPPFRVGVRQDDLLAGLRQVWKDKNFVMFSLAGSGFWLLWLQMMSTLPLLVTRITGHQSSVAWMYTLEAILTLSLQYPIAHWSVGRWSSESRLQTAMSAMILGLLLTSMASTPALLWTSLAIFTVGVVIGDPALQESTARRLDPRLRGAYLGFNSIGMAISGGLGYMISGWLYQTTLAWGHPSLGWIGIASMGIVCLAYLNRAINPPAPRMLRSQA
ncbi:MFS transporter [Leeia oryzae]|uniref:MFS transporter n=1 Tax=Leeia oryzae TaxID=356662 RepID=UPI000379A6D3|nr:MFS transporter [Leeia oryzae]